MEALAKEFAGRATVVKIDIDLFFHIGKTVREQFGIEGLPLVLLYKDGKEISRFEGAANTQKANLRQALLEILEE